MKVIWDIPKITEIYHKEYRYHYIGLIQIKILKKFKK